MNVVAAWRTRELLLRRQALRCEACSATCVVRRRVCVRCGGRNFQRVQLPHCGRVLAVTRGSTLVEQLDQRTVNLGAVLLALDAATVSCLLADADTDYVEHLHGAELYLSVRRLPTNEDERAPIAYGVRACADIATRRNVRERCGVATDQEET